MLGSSLYCCMRSLAFERAFETSKAMSSSRFMPSSNEGSGSGSRCSFSVLILLFACSSSAVSLCSVVSSGLLEARLSRARLRSGRSGRAVGSCFMPTWAVSPVQSHQDPRGSVASGSTRLRIVCTAEKRLSGAIKGRSHTCRRAAGGNRCLSMRRVGHAVDCLGRQDRRAFEELSLTQTTSPGCLRAQESRVSRWRIHEVGLAGGRGLGRCDGRSRRKFAESVERLPSKPAPDNDGGRYTMPTGVAGRAEGSLKEIQN